MIQILGNSFCAGLCFGLFFVAMREGRKGFMILQALFCVLNAAIAIAAYLHKFGS